MQVKPGMGYSTVMLARTERLALPVVLVLASLLPRLSLMAYNENFYGDAVARTELALRWSAHPHWIASASDGAYQFGPLQLYLIGIALRLGFPIEDAGRWVSFGAGVASVLPLFFLSRRLFGREA
ncbi:MAG TPA: hypothetical protein VEY30_10515, partial [Myxococcaceae bacterium]|nr:hypothetical protein [Myxococcaceae bacterium]